ncbi:MAG TPA: glycosyltransferase family 4 protein [Gemmatimonadaceae bacterium]|nr:glycosyltransferase family 4 protein [Gemmatimonadaceae bacterium]
MMLESDGPGGAEVMLLRLSEELRKRGHYVLPVGPSQRTGWLAEQFRRHGFNPEVYHLRRPLDPGGVRDLLRLFTRYRIDVVHSHEFTMAVYGAAAARLVGLPQIITMHGGLTVCKALRRRVALRWAMRQSSHVVMVSNATRRQFSQDLGVDESAFSVIPNGVPVRTGSADAVRREFGIAPNECVLLAVGNLELHKGHHVLLQSLTQLRERMPNESWRLIIAGGRGGAQHGALTEYVRDHGLANRVHISLNRQDIPDLQAAADVFVMPSIWEGLPLALLEAMVAHKAIVASATAGIPEAIRDGEDGLLVQPGDVGALTDALQIMIGDPEKRRRFADAAEERARQNFTAQVMAERYERVYMSALTASRKVRVA